jgi:Transposase, Mutator family
MGDPPRSKGGTAVSSNVPVAEATNDEAVLPERVREALGQLVGAAKEGLLALSVGVGLGVLAEMLEEEVDGVVGPKGKWNPDRTALRHGHDDGEVTLGGRRVEVRRPRVRTPDGSAEVPLQTYEHFADRDPLRRVVLERMLAGVSTRRYRRTQEPVGQEVEVQARSTSKSSVSRTFIERTRQALGELMSRQLADLRLAVMMIVALGITTEGVKIPLGLGRGRPRTRPSPRRCCRTWSSAASIPSRACCSSSTDRRRSGKPCGRCSATSRSRDVFVTRRGT